MQVEVKVSAKSTFGEHDIFKTEVNYDGSELSDLVIAIQKAINHISAKKAKDRNSP